MSTMPDDLANIAGQLTTEDGAPAQPAKQGWSPKAITMGGPVFPLIVLFFLNAVDELDQTAFNVLLPDIANYFHISGASALGLLALSSPVAIILGLLMGYLGDRTRRTPLARTGAGFWGVFSVMTGLAPNVPMLAVARAGSALGKVVNGPVHQSLIADYYQPAARPRVFFIYNSANYLGRIVGPLVAGVLATAFVWQTPFFVFGVATGIIILLSLAMREPQRGRWDRVSAGASEEELAAEEGAPPKFGESWRLLYTVATVRRVYFTVPLLVASFIGIGSLMSLYYYRVFGIDTLQRSVLLVFDDIASMVGLFVGGPIIAKVMARDPGDGFRVLRFSAIGAAFFIFLLSLAPTWQLAVLCAMGRALVGAAVFPTLAATLSLVMPPRARSLGFSVFTLWVIPSLITLPIIGAVADEYGYRYGLMLLVPLYVVGVFVLSTAAGSVKSDIENNHRWTLLEAQARLDRQRWREALERGDTDTSEFMLLEVRDIHFSYGPLKVLHGVNLSVPYGSKIALLGSNGAGKSTLLDVISGLNTPDIGTGGTVWYENEDITFLLPEDRMNRGIVSLTGGQATFPSLSVEENLRIGAYKQLGDKKLVDERLAEVIELFPVLGQRLNQRGGTLSGGEQQMMALGRSLIAGPQLLLIDELSLGLSPIVMQDVLKMVEEIARRGTTIVLVEQSINIALELTEHAYLMEKGVIVHSAPSSDFVGHGALAKAVFLGTGAGS